MKIKDESVPDSLSNYNMYSTISWKFVKRFPKIGIYCDARNRFKWWVWDNLGRKKIEITKGCFNRWIERFVMDWDYEKIDVVYVRSHGWNILRIAEYFCSRLFAKRLNPLLDAWITIYLKPVILQNKSIIENSVLMINDNSSPKIFKVFNKIYDYIKSILIEIEFYHIKLHRETSKTSIIAFSKLSKIFPQIGSHLSKRKEETRI